MRIVEIKMLRWMCRHKRMNKIRNKNIRDKDKVRILSIERKLQEMLKMV